jgi:regulator of sigma E protease
MRNNMKKICTTLLGLSSVIIVHEFGHFLLCKLFHVITPVFSVGFGPKLIGYQIGNTLFQLALLPLGGYVAIDPASIATKPYIQKLLINVAGVSFNTIFAFILIAFALYIISGRKATRIIDEITPESPASKAGLRAEDAIIAYNGSPVSQDLTPLLQCIQQSAGNTIPLTIKRENTTEIINVTLGSSHPLLGPNIGYLGASFKVENTTHAPVGLIITQAAQTTNQLLIRFATLFFGFFKKKNREQLSGPVGIISGANTAQSTSPAFFIMWLAIINLNVAFFNILPLPLLDGGHIVQDTIEALYGAPLPSTLMQVINLLFLFFFLLFIMHITLRDIKRLNGHHK